MKRNNLLTALLAVAIFAMASLALAQSSVPNLINFQGKLTDNSGNPVPDGVHSFTFRVFTNPAGGAALWSEGPVAIFTNGGLFNHQLGSGATALPPNLFSNNDSLYLEIEANGEIQSPRVKLISTPYTRVAGDLKNEPGVASNTGTSTITMDGTVQTLLSQSITVPAAGYVLVIGTAWVFINHLSGAFNSFADFGVSNVAGTFPANQTGRILVSGNAPSGSYAHTVTVQGLFSVSAGANTFFFLGDEGINNFEVFDRQLSLIYIPTAYGTVVPTVAGSGENIFDDKVAGQPIMATADAAAEQTQKFNAERIARELTQVKAEMEARIQKLEEQMRQSQQGVENEN